MQRRVIVMTVYCFAFNNQGGVDMEQEYVYIILCISYSQVDMLKLQ